MLTIKLTGELFKLTWMLFRLTGVLYRLTGVLFRLTGVLFRLTGVQSGLTGDSLRVILSKCPRALSSIPSSKYQLSIILSSYEKKA